MVKRLDAIQNFGGNVLYFSPVHLIIMTLIFMAVGIFLPMGPFVEYVKLEALSFTYFLYLPFILLGYMLLTQAMKTLYIKRYS